jgi:DNA segregation ATPase FtsK/SpoIIIE-like protein
LIDVKARIASSPSKFVIVPTKWTKSLNKFAIPLNHINQYHKLFKEGVATEPMPHLFIISDEFAELKSEQPLIQALS